MSEKGILRSRLQKNDPALDRCLERMWQVARDEWLDCLDVRMGSSNASSHLRNIENHLDRIMVGFEEVPGTRFTEGLNAFETYLLLSAVLLHDIGRTQSERDEHGERARQLLKDEYAHLGIPSREIARTLGAICICHCPPENSSRLDMLRRLSTTAIEPYGEAREQLIAALLTLADCMDAANTRALPPYLTRRSGIGPIGQFRRSIRGVYTDPFARMIRTVLIPEEKGDQPDSENKAGSEKAVSRYSLLMEMERDRGKEWDALLPDGQLDGLRRELGLNDESPCPLRNPGARALEDLDKLEKLLETRLALNSTTPSSLPGVAQFRQLKAWRKGKKAGKLEKIATPIAELSVTTPHIYWLVALGLLHFVPVDPSQRSKASNVKVPLPPKAELAMVLGDMRRNAEALQEVQDALAASGILLAAWLVERDEHLYNRRGCETFEPLFDGDYLLRVAEGMWDHACHVFGDSRFPYQDLASHLGDPNTARVRRAVRRIAIVASGLPLQSSEGPRSNLGAVWAGNTHWGWRVARNGDKCQYVALEKVRQAVEGLEAPNEPYGTELRI